MAIQDTGIKKNECANCHKPIILAWCGKQGMYCSNVCYEVAELFPPLADETKSSRENNMSEEKTAAPAAAPKVADKKKAAPAAKKAEKVKTPKEPKPAGGRRENATFPKTATIHLLGGDNPFRAGSSRAERFNLLKEGMTVGKWLEVIAAKGLPVNFMVLETATANKLIKVS